MIGGERKRSCIHNGDSLHTKIVQYTRYMIVKSGKQTHAHLAHSSYYITTQTYTHAPTRAKSAEDWEGKVGASD